MAMTLTTIGRDTFLPAIQESIRQASLVDENGDLIKDWSAGAIPMDPALWADGRYTEDLEWLFVRQANEAPRVIAGVAWQDALGQTLAIDPLVTPFIIEETGQRFISEPEIRLFGVP